MTESILAFDRDPLFGNLSNPLVKVETRLNRVRQRCWCWKAPEFFWFWNEDEPDFFGVFLEGSPKSKMSWSGENKWFEEAAQTTDLKHLRKVLQHQLHNGRWMRAITVGDPRPEKQGLWRILWRQREFLLQNASNGRAIRFVPETNWNKDSPHWSQLKHFEHDAAFFAQMFWPLLVERWGRLQTAFEFLELPVEVQKNPIRFGRDDHEVFVGVMRAALIVVSTLPFWSEDFVPLLEIRFHHRTFAPIYNLFGEVNQWTRAGLPIEILPHVQHLAEAFQPYLVSGFALHSVAPSPLALPAQHNEPHLSIKAKGPFTAHEHLEAILTVRDWLAENATELLPEWNEWKAG